VGIAKLQFFSFVMGIIDWRITKKTKLSFEHSQNKYVVGSSFWVAYIDYKSRT
jgi:hypothetical protein